MINSNAAELSKIWLSSPHMGEAELGFVEDAFKSNWIAPLGPYVDGFESDIETYTGITHVAALSSGTAALHLALIILGIMPGDEVICQTLTFSATVNPIVYLGAVPIFVDSEMDTWNMCPKLLERAIKERIEKGKKPKAIIPVHLYGMPAKIVEIIQIADKYGIPVIEDAAEALGSTLNGKCAGTFGMLSILSFNGNKIITTSGGGALMSNNEKYVVKARFLATQAREKFEHYEHLEIGYNYRMSNICAAIGRGQIIVLNERVKQRRAIFKAYFEKFSDIPGITFLSEPPGYFSNRWLTTIVIDPSVRGITKDIVRNFLEVENIESRPIWKPMHLQPVFKDYPAYLNGNSEWLFNHGLCLPSGSNLTPEQFERIVTSLNLVFRSN